MLSPPQHCNGATLDQAANSPGSGSSFNISRIGSPRTICAGRPSTGLSIDEIELLACQPAEKGEGGILRQSPKILGFLRVLRTFFSLACIPSVYPWQPGKRDRSSTYRRRSARCGDPVLHAGRGLTTGNCGGD